MQTKNVSDKIALRFILNVFVYLLAFLSSIMAKDLISPLYVLTFTGIVLVAAFTDFLNKTHLPRYFLGISTAILLFILFSRIRLDTVIESLMQAVLLVTAAKLMEEKDARDYAQLAGLGLASVVCTAMLSVEMSFIFYCVAAGILTTLILITAAWYRAEAHAKLSFKEILQLLLRGLSLFFTMLPVCLVIFFLAPRTQGSFIGWHGRYGTAETGFSEQVRLGDVSGIQSSNRLVMRAEMAPLTPRVPYWRGLILDIFDGNIWTSSRAKTDHTSFVPEPNSAKIFQSIVLEPRSNRRYLFTLDQPLAVTEVDALNVGDGIFLYTGAAPTQRIRYNVLSVLSTQMHTPQKTGQGLKRALSLPKERFPRLQQLVDTLTQGLDEKSKVNAVLDYLAPPHFSYSMQGLPQTADALEQFVFVTRKGNCEYFAAAAGVMLRLAGIPSRLIAGYKGGTYNQAGGFYSVTEESAHVWIEVWNSKIEAWERFDPTPPGGISDSELLMSSTWNQYMELLDYQWTKMVINYNWEIQLSMLEKLRNIVRNPGASLTPSTKNLKQVGQIFFWFLLVIVLAFAAIGFVRLRLNSRLPQDKLLRHFLQKMRHLGYTRMPSEGLQEFTLRIKEPALQMAAFQFVRLFQAYYYKDQPMDKETQIKLTEMIKLLDNKKE